MVVQPEGLTADAAYAIDQFALAGGKVLAFVDPVAETSARRATHGHDGCGGPPTGVREAAEGLGRRLRSDKVAGDIAHARRVQFGGGPRASVTEYVRLARPRPPQSRRAATCCRAASSASISASAGLPRQGRGRHHAVDAHRADQRRSHADRARKVRHHARSQWACCADYKPEGKPLMLAARVSGTAKSAFPEGAPKPAEGRAGEEGGGRQGQGGWRQEPREPPRMPRTTEARPEPRRPRRPPRPRPAKPHVASGKVNVIVVADTDLLNDQFWVEVRDFLGQQVAIPNAHNGAFVLGALENLSGSDALISLRGRGISDRPFELVERTAPRRRAPLPREGAGADRQAARRCRTSSPSSRSRRGRELVILTEKDRAGDREVPRRHAVDRGANCAR